MTRRSLNVTPKTTEQHLIVRSGKFEAEASIIKHCARGITLLKLTTDGHKASRGLSATAELLVAITVNASPYVGQIVNVMMSVNFIIYNASNLCTNGMHG